VFRAQGLQNQRNEKSEYGGTLLLQAVILAGGLGTRLRPFTDQVPKAMVPVCGRPFLEHQILLLKSQAIVEILLLVGHRAQQIQDYFGDGSGHGVRISYSREGAPLGTGGAIRLAGRKLHRNFLLLNGDTFLPINYQGVVERFLDLQPWGLVVACLGNDSNVKPNLTVSRDMRVIDAAGTDPSHVNAGAMIFSDRILELIPEAQTFSLDKDLFPKLIARNALCVYETQIRYFDMGTLEGLKKLEVFLGS
jgi:NDP-sugar pyrophosphorylase family protein